jgi:hypothetical protein
MIKEIEPESFASSSNNQRPRFYQSMGGNALQDRLGSKNTYSGFMKVVGEQNMAVTVLAGETTTTTLAHGVKTSIPFVFLYLKTNGYFTRVGFRTAEQTITNWIISGIGNAVIDSKNFSFSITNFDSVDKVYDLKAIIFEVTN